MTRMSDRPPTEEEIDRRAIDRELRQRQDQMAKDLADLRAKLENSALGEPYASWVQQQYNKDQRRSEMWAKIAQSFVGQVLIAIAFGVGYAVWKYVSDKIRTGS